MFALSTLVGIEGLGAGSGRAIREEMEPAEYLARGLLRALALEHRAAAPSERDDRARARSTPGSRACGREKRCPGARTPTRPRASVEATGASAAARRRRPTRGSRAGDAVRVRRMRPAGHTRCPRYVRGATGVVEAVRGLDAFPDIGPYAGPEEPVYAVAFASDDLFGPSAEGRVDGAARPLRELPGAGVSHDHDHDHDELALRAAALEAVLVEKGLLDDRPDRRDRRALRARPRPAERRPRRRAGVGRRRLPRAPARRRRRRDRASSATAASRATRWSSSRTRPTCTTSSSARSAPATRGPSSAFRRPGTRARRTARASSPSRGRCSASSGSSFPPSSEIRVWDSTSEVRYLVLPERPPGTDGMDEEELAALVTRDSMIGTGLAVLAGVSGVDPDRRLAGRARGAAARERRARLRRAVGEPRVRRRRRAARRGCRRLRGVPCAADRGDRRVGRVARARGPRLPVLRALADRPRADAARRADRRPCLARGRPRGDRARVGARPPALTTCQGRPAASQSSCVARRRPHRRDRSSAGTSPYASPKWSTTTSHHSAALSMSRRSTPEGLVSE